jgi:adenosylhomocysteinase
MVRPCEPLMPDDDVRDVALAAAGEELIEWAAREMPVLRQVRERFRADRPLRGLRIGACLHVTSETANLALALRDGGAEVALCASNPLTTNDAVAAALVRVHGMPTFAARGVDADRYYRHIEAVLAHRPQVTLDDGADLVSTLHQRGGSALDEVAGGTEETRTGVIRLRAMAEQGVLRYPVIAVDGAATTRLFDNRHGTGQSTIDGILRATNALIAGTTFVVAGYGWCGRGVAMRARGHGADVVVTEVDPLKALEAAMDGYRVMPMADAAPIGDILVTATGACDVIDRPHLEAMKDGAILANAGHFDDEINLDALAELAVETRRVRPLVDEHRLADGRRLLVLAEGRVVNLAAAEGHPAAVVDLMFATQALSVQHLCGEGVGLEARVHDVPAPIDAEVARLKLRAMDVAIDTLTEDQRRYLSGWEEGT